MHAFRFDTYIPANHRVEVTLPDDFPAGGAEIIVLEKTLPDTQAGMALREFSAWLKQQEPSGRSREEIDAQIAEERNAWGDD
ncbi:hypothetical protein AGMMS49543_27310 [Betaproteobacteria bacterium]|nr:hypothetical protein AGMMS49543_27310 [Betaproteobacteria bacterium]GHU24315.1 hypothetical protein AGMMS50243_27250 [Betaproteobacteria bacterium]